MTEVPDLNCHHPSDAIAFSLLSTSSLSVDPDAGAALRSLVDHHTALSMLTGETLEKLVVLACSSLLPPAVPLLLCGGL